MTSFYIFRINSSQPTCKGDDNRVCVLLLNKKSVEVKLYKSMAIYLNSHPAIDSLGNTHDNSLNRIQKFLSIELKQKECFRFTFHYISLLINYLKRQAHFSRNKSQQIKFFSLTFLIKGFCAVQYCLVALLSVTSSCRSHLWFCNIYLRIYNIISGYVFQRIH